jgi:hypothetical protein
MQRISQEASVVYCKVQGVLLVGLRKKWYANC